jgi:hypothetical protein
LDGRPIRGIGAVPGGGSAWLHAQAFNGLAGDIGYHVKVLAEVQDREPG